MAHAGTAAVRTDVDIVIPDFFQHFVHWQARQHGLKTLPPLNAEDDFQIAFFAPVIQEPMFSGKGNRGIQPTGKNSVNVCRKREN